MKITDLRARTVAIPTQGMLRHNTGVHPGYLMRTVLELFTDEGIVGLGEVGGGDQRAALTRLKPRIVGMNPFDLEAIKLKVLRSIYYLSNARLYGAIEIACLDIQGKAAGVPMHALLGGKLRDAVPLIAYLFWRYDRPGGGDDVRAEDMADLCVELKETLGVRAMKLKAGVMEPMEEARVLKLCRQRLGDGFGLRIDPNGVWSVATAVRVGRALEDLGLEYYEDPAWGLEGMRAVRRQVRIPLATNMYPNKFDDLGPAIRMNAVDIVLTDLHYWEGPRGVKDLCAVCRTFNLGVAMHSGAEFGVEMAAMLHTAASIPTMNVAGDAHYHYLEDDIIIGGKMSYVDGAMRVPEGPGLGVTLDEEKMARYEKYFQDHGDYYARFHEDPRRPLWYPNVGGI
jgi:glucarate dehydratase